MARLGAPQRPRDVAPGALLGAALSHAMTLDPLDFEALERIPFQSRAFPREGAILQVGEASQDLYLVLDGVAARVTATRLGVREILGFLLPGDVFDWPLQHLNVRVAPGDQVGLDHAVIAVGGCTVGVVRRQVLQKALAEGPKLAEAFERHALREQAIARAWMVNIGARRANARLGHLICEIYARYRAMGLSDGASCPLAMTQIHLAEALGLSSVHVNRELQALRAEGLLRLTAGVLTLPDLARLQRLSDFSGAYLDAGLARRWAPGEA